jgi:signal peptidase I
MTVASEISPPAPSPHGLRFLAVCGSLLWPGLGHLLVGHRRRALGWFGIGLLISAVGLICICSPSLAPLLAIIVPVTVLVTLAMLVDAFRTARIGQAARVPTAVLRYGIGAVVLGMVLFGAVERLILWTLGPTLFSYVEAVVIPSPPPQEIAFMSDRKARGGAMAPNLVWGDRFLLHKRVDPRRWDIIVFYSPDFSDQRYVMRLVGLPGDRVEIVNSRLTINGQPLQAPAGVGPYVGTLPSHLRRSGGPTGSEGDPITLADDEYYVLGDNSELALDSRYWTQSLPGYQRGTIPRSEIIGVATLNYWPLTRWRRLR